MKLKRSLLYTIIAIVTVLIIVAAGVILIPGLLNTDNVPSGGENPEGSDLGEEARCKS